MTLNKMIKVLKVKEESYYNKKNNNLKLIGQDLNSTGMIIATQSKTWAVDSSGSF